MLETDVCRSEPEEPDARGDYKQALRPTAERRNWVPQLRAQFQASINRCCDSACLSRTAYYYQVKLPEDDELIDVLLALI